VPSITTVGSSAPSAMPIAPRLTDALSERLDASHGDDVVTMSPALKAALVDAILH
jgi:hypothetical protein